MSKLACVKFILSGLSSVAKLILGKQLFSIAALFVKRGSLSTESLESLTLLNANQLLLEKLSTLCDVDLIQEVIRRLKQSVTKIEILSYLRFSC